MVLNLQEVAGIGKTTMEKMRAIGIDSIEKLASINLDELLKISGIGKSTAIRYIENANKILEEIKNKEKKEIPEVNEVIEKNDFSKKEATTDVKESIIKKAISDNKIITKGRKIFDRKVNLKKVNVPKKMVFPIREVIPKKHNISRSDFPKKQILNKIPPQKIKHKKKEVNVAIKTFFPLIVMQKIRFLHFKIKQLEKFLQNESEEFNLEELNYVWDYIKLLNVNYKTHSQIKIFKELEITQSFIDPIENKEINIWDLMFECARVLWVLARVYTQLSKKYEADNNLKSAITAMVECSIAYKTAGYFSAACTRQEDKGISLISEILELNSEEARIIAQSLAAMREENKKNFFIASKMYAGLSALSNRLFYLKHHDNIKAQQLKAQLNYDMGKAYHLKAKALALIPNQNEHDIIKLQQKANYYFFKAEEVWEFMRNNFKSLSKEELDNLNFNLSIVNENIIENDVEILDYNEIKEIQEIEPFIAVPENIAPILPRTTLYLTMNKPIHLEFNTFKEFQKQKIKRDFHFSKMEKLQNKKAGIGRVIKELKVLYENNDISINKFSELLEKYSIELTMIESAIEKLKNPDMKAKKLSKKHPNKFIIKK